MEDHVNSPAWYGGADNPYEVIKVIDAWELGFSLGNAVKYIPRAGKKGGTLEEVQDLKKAVWYIEHQIARLMDTPEYAKAMCEGETLGREPNAEDEV